MQRVAWRRVAVLIAPPLAVLTVVIYLTAPGGLTGSTRCLPFVEPRIAIDSGLKGRERTLALAHETAHAAQCREQGVIRNYVARLTRVGRMNAELGAYCAEGRAELQLGQQADLVVARVLDELEEGYPWFRGTPRAELRARLLGLCPNLLAAASPSG